MVYLESLKMQNIRSIADTPHAIEFLRPLTLIQGNNGTGKTTIIEALNYVTSGSLPSGKLATFIHDPKIAQKKKVDAQIMLKFNNIAGSTTVATRRMCSTVSTNASGLQTKSDEPTIKIINKNGKEETISTKVSDFNAAVVKHLGVSPAVLENVVFCHQEESNWPLSEPKKLKEKFDEIFEVSEYVTVMENIKVERKKLENNMKVIDGQVPLLEENVNRLNRLQSEFKKKKKNQEKLLFAKKELEDKFSELKEVENKLQDELSKIGDNEEEKWKIQAELAEKREKINGEIGEKRKELMKINQDIEKIKKYIQAEENLKSKNKEFERAIEKSKPDLDELFKEKVTKNYLNEVEVLHSQLEDDLRQASSSFKKVEEEARKLENEFSKLSMNIKFNEDNIEKKRNLISETGTAMDKIKSEKSAIASELEEKRAELGQQKGCSFLYSKWEKDIESENCCPLCERGCEKSETKKLAEKVRRMNKDLPDEISMLEKRVKQLSEKEEKLLKAIPLVEEIETLSLKVKEDKKELVKKEEIKEVKKKEKDESKIKLEEIQMKKQKTLMLLGEVRILDRILKDVKKAESEFLVEKNKLNFEDGSEEDSEKLKKKKDDFEWQTEGLEEEIKILNDRLKNIKEPEFQDLQKKKEIANKLNSVMREKQEVNNKIKETEGVLKSLKEDLKDRQSEINKTGSDTVARLRDKVAEKLILEQISKDLEIFAKSLDDAIIEYHKQKMESINIILEEHWPYVYRGTDIETIKIRSDPISSGKNRSYDYKVVMVIDGKELEMRDRCSAGQKVLASILIRVALSDVFATGCPILALDEPTTNLDRDKVENVAEMLENLLRLRENNLQLIIITHDTDFVSRLYRACSPEYYYGLLKDEYGVSMLRRHNRMGDTADIDG
ncbi:hypothetical protein FO519_003665 [Halicephalobus sp. NKZ332]|nr:hypothetical protein FO519_003665 [Halicephalobus sp. NKZ332]